MKLRHPPVVRSLLWLFWLLGTATVVYGFIAHPWASSLALSLNYVGALVMGGGVFIICILSRQIPIERVIRGVWFALYYMAYGLFIALSAKLTSSQFISAFALINICLVALVITGRQFWPKRRPE